MRKKIVLLIITFVFLFLPKTTWASSKITLVNRIKDISNQTDLVVTYLIMPAVENEDGVVGEPTELVVDFSGVDVFNYELVKNVELDFSDVEYQKAGTYRYVIRQKKLSDIETFSKSQQIYFVYVDVTINPDESKNIEVSDLVYDTENQEKTSLEFLNEVKYTYFEIENRVEGMLREQDIGVYFKYKIQITGLVNSKYRIIGQDPFIYYHGEYIKTEDYYTVLENEEDNYMYVYLKDGQKITIGKLIDERIVNNTVVDDNIVDNNIEDEDINNNQSSSTVEVSFNQIPIGTVLSISKIGDEKWLTIIDGKETNTKTIKAKDKDNYILIINRRDFDSAITGVFYKLSPYIIGIILTVLLFIIYKKYRIKEEEL